MERIIFCNEGWIGRLAASRAAHFICFFIQVRARFCCFNSAKWEMAFFCSSLTCRWYESSSKSLSSSSSSPSWSVWHSCWSSSSSSSPPSSLPFCSSSSSSPARYLERMLWANFKNLSLLKWVLTYTRLVYWMLIQSRSELSVLFLMS